VLSIGKLVAGAEDYYLSMVAGGREEYYTGTGESPGTWLGSGAADLGLDGEVTPEDLRAILAGVAPGSGTELGLRRRSGTRVAGFDLTFSAPKSISLLYALGSPEQAAAARSAHERAVTEGLAYLERHAASARRGTDGQRQIATTGLVAAAFVHRTSRNGDPQLHTHVLAANAVHGADGRWSAPDARSMYFQARTAGFVYQAALRANLVETLGVTFRPVHRGAAELGGIDPGVLRRFSTRRAEIEEYLAVFGGTSGRSAELAALATRAPKSASRDDPAIGVDLRTQWRQLAADHGVDPDHLFPNFGPPREVTLEDATARTLVESLLGPDGLTAQDSTFQRRDVVRAIAEQLVDGAHLEAIEAGANYTLSRPEAVDLPAVGRGGELLHTTRELLALESKLVETAIAQRGRVTERTSVCFVLVDSALADQFLAQHPHLSHEQSAMLRSLVSSGHQLEVVVGKAGAGKTTALSLAREIFEQAGCTVLGTALSARAAEELEASAGIDSVTLARFLGQVDQGGRTLGTRDVLVVDEAGMVGTRALYRLAELTSASGAKLVLVGDPRQLPEIEAGGAFGALAAGLGAHELSENRRQLELWERAALDLLRSGDVSLALAAYDEHGLIRLSDTMAEARSDLVARWLTAQDDGAEVLMLAVNRRDVAALNREARDVLQRRGSIGAELVVANGRPFAPGDAVVCLRNARRMGVINGTRGTVVGLDGTDLVIDTATGPRTLSSQYLSKGHLDYGYATTVHRSQGATYDRAFVLATESLSREAGYVAMSRARISTELFVPGGGAFEQGLGPEVPDVEPLARTAARLAVSRAKTLASSHLDEPSLDRTVPTTGSIPTPMPVAKGLAMDIDVAPSPAPALEAAPHRPGLSRDFTATDFSGPEQPVYIVAALGSRPGFVDEQPRYDRITQAIDHYRAQYAVEGDDPLGRRPFEAIPRLAYDAVAAEIRDYERCRWRELEPPDLELPERGLGMGR
jgi:conjugative relaxase-like TrwC/TraI family protein